VKPFYSGRIVSKLMAKHTSLLTKNTAFEHKLSNDKMAKVTKWWPNTIPRSKKPDIIWSNTKDLEGKIVQAA
jgi:hypothetical protein